MESASARTLPGLTRTPAAAAALAATLGIAAACWVISVQQMNGVGLMLMLVALGVMSLAWMVVIAVVVLAQKLLPAIGVIEVPLALAITGFGIWMLVAPSSVPWLAAPM